MKPVESAMDDEEMHEEMHEMTELPRYLDPHKRRHRRVWTWLIVAAVLGVLVLLAAIPSTPRQKVIDSVNDLVNDRIQEAIRTRINTTSHFKTLDDITAKNAYITLFTHYPTEEVDEEHERFFDATRILAHQLLHAPETRSPAGYPLVVIINEYITEEKRDRLRRDGAILWEPEPVDWGWLGFEREGLREAWRAVMVKLRLWELTQFERVCFMDGDMVLNRPLDDVFGDPASSIVRSTGTDPAQIQSDEAPLPTEYVFGGTPELTYEHNYPPTNASHDFYRGDENYFNGGFFVTRPDPAMLEYYLSLLQTPDRFDPGFPEQNLWNYAHRREGNMPWQTLYYGWNTHFPSLNDKKGGVATMHTHWWRPIHGDLEPYMAQVKASMDAYWQGQEEVLEQLGV